MKLMLVSIAVLGVVQSTCAQGEGKQASFNPMGFMDAWDWSYARGVSPDGTLLFGRYTTAGDQGGYVWHDGWFDRLVAGANATVVDSSADNSTIVGCDQYGSAFRCDDGVIETVEPWWALTMVFAVSDDGDVVVGNGDGHAAYWKHWSGVFHLPEAGPKYYSGWATGVDATGRTIVGMSHNTKYDDEAESMPMCWVNGVASPLGHLPTGHKYKLGEANAVTPDGKVIVGFSSSMAGYEAVKWENGHTQGLGFLPHPLKEWAVSVALGVSADGKVIVGYSGEWFGFGNQVAVNPHAFIWTEETGMRAVQDVLAEHGVDIIGWNLEEATAISADGTVITGHGLAPAYHPYQAWAATIPRACYADCDKSGGLDIEDLICFQTLFALGDPGADCDKSGEQDADDFICFQTAFAFGCLP